MELSTLSRAVLADRPPLFVTDFAAARPQLEACFAGRKVLVIGAGGSIGRASAEMLLEQRPARTLLVDISENNLASVTRRLRNRFGMDCPDFEAWPLDFSGPAFHALLEREHPEVILNFAAFKHVRSEKDHFSLAELLRVNVFANLSLLEWAIERQPARIFAISTDKAAGPVSCMGASKRLMEQLLWSAAGQCPALTVSSTRFANVLFSDGSLPASFVERLAQRQPLAGPSDVERYFITFEEAARLCLLAASHPASCEILVPRLQPSDMLRFDTIAERFLQLHGFAARHYAEDSAAALAALEADAATGHWPCLFSPSTTSGEKAHEEFRESDETLAAEQPYSEVEAIDAKQPAAWSELSAALTTWRLELSDPHWLLSHSKTDVVARLAQLVPEFDHTEAGASLDQKI